MRMDKIKQEIIKRFGQICSKIFLETNKTMKIICRNIFFRYLKYLIKISFYRQMEGKKPDPRWQNFIEQSDAQGKKIGFKLQGNDHLFRYDEEGGWLDEKGQLYDCEGFLMDGEYDNNVDEESDSEADDDEIVDEFEQMLIEQEEGIVRKPKPAEKKPTSPPVETVYDLDTQLKKYIEKLQKGQQLREGLSPEVWVFYKMKSNCYEQIKPQVEKQQNVNSKNLVINKIKLKIKQKRKQLLAANKWLTGDFLLDYSGTSLADNVYGRYWFGWVKASAETFFNVLDDINKSKEFNLLKPKTVYALKSKFYLKSKMKDTITQLKGSLKDTKQQDAVLVKINNLPEEFPISFILDLIELSGGDLKDVEDIDIVDNFSADLICKKKTAELFTNIEGYPHEEKQYIWLDVSDLKREIKYNDLFKIQIDAEYKVPTRETADTLALENSFAELAKVYEKDYKYRLVVNQNVLKKLLMFRGETLNVIRVVRFEKGVEETLISKA